MKYLKFLLLFGLVLLFGALLSGQSAPDTIALIRQLKEKGKAREASRLLEAWCDARPPHAETLWLYAQVEYSGKKFNRSESLYREAIALQPDNFYLRLDFVETLLNMGRFGKAKAAMAELPKGKNSDAHALFVQAKYHYWTGDFKKAERLAATSWKAAKKPATNALANKISLAQAHWLTLGSNFLKDDQPLLKIEPQIAGGKYFNRYLDLTTMASASLFRLDTIWINAYAFNISNSMRLSQQGTVLYVQGGIFQLENCGTALTGQLRATQRLPEGLSLTAELGRKPSLWNISSISAGIFENQILLTLDWHERHGFWANTGVQPTYFQDGNQVLSTWVWMLSPPLVLQRFSGRAGYSFGFADSKENRFNPKKSLAEILNPFDPEAEIRGAFFPYFTPEQMSIHAILAQVEYHFSENISGGLKGKYGLQASAMNPYLYLSTGPNGEQFIQRAFLKTEFIPVEAGASLLFQLHGDLSIGVNYSFTRNFFYENHSAGLFVKKIFDQ